MNQVQSFSQKRVFLNLLAGLAILMVALPPLALVNSILTSILDKAEWYQPIERYVVPWQARSVSVVLQLVGIKSVLTPQSNLSVMYLVKDGQAMPVDLAWNCLGWQSVLLFVVSLFAGLGGNFSNWSRFKCVVVGLLGTILVNILRMTFIALGIYYGNPVVVSIVHDYFVAFVTIIWLAVFWWVSFAVILQEKTNIL